MREKNFNNEKPDRGLRATTSITEEAAAEPADQPVEELPKKESKVGIVANCEKLFPYLAKRQPTMPYFGHFDLVDCLFYPEKNRKNYPFFSFGIDCGNRCCGRLQV